MPAIQTACTVYYMHSSQKHTSNILGTVTIDMIEQAMRASSDDLLVIPFLNTIPGSPEFLIALGHLLAASHTMLPNGSPLLAWYTSTQVDANWRDNCPCVPASVWGELIIRERLYKSNDTTTCPMQRLLELRHLPI
jgi:hypothetical protein